LHLIDAIEVKGSKKAVLKRGFSTENEQATTYGELPKQMSKLVANELFADVFFEVEGKRVPAHRNILSCRSDYFGAMLSCSANFRESNKQSPIYIPNVKYDVFIQVLSFLYTGHVDIWKLSYCDGLDLIRTADLFNLTKLEELILFTIGS
jgi:BTB/POZ domain-containing protein 9